MDYISNMTTSNYLGHILKSYGNQVNDIIRCKYKYKK